MWEIKEAEKVKLFAGIITAFLPLFEKVKEMLVAKFGAIDFEMVPVPFNFTDYYEEEMGTNLQRKFISFTNLISPSDIADIKVLTNEMEKKIAEDGKCSRVPNGEVVRRPVNIDPGYLNLSKIVLVSTKNYSHRIYLGKGIYAEITLMYKDKSFRGMDWTYPDYLTKDYLNFFANVRNIYHRQRKIKYQTPNLNK